MPCLSLNRMPEKFKSKPECVMDKFGQEYAGIYVGECELSDDTESRRNTLTFPNDTSRRTSQSCLGILRTIKISNREAVLVQDLVYFEHKYADKPLLF